MNAGGSQQSPAQQARGKSSSAMKWVMGCGIGCAVTVVLAAICCVALWRAAWRGTKDSLEAESWMISLVEYTDPKYVREGQITSTESSSLMAIPPGLGGGPGGPAGDVAYVYAVNHIFGRIACLTLDEKLFVHDFRTQQTTNFTQKQWTGLSRPMWSDDGAMLAFTATKLPNPTGVPRLGELYLYDAASGKLEILAHGALAGGRGRETFSVAWSRDCRNVYYITIDQQLARARVETGELTVSDLPAYGVLAVSESDIVIIRQERPTYTTTGRISIRRHPLPSCFHQPDEEQAVPAKEKVLYRGSCLWEGSASPSRRFLLFYDRTGYFGKGGVLDTETGKRHAVPKWVEWNMGISTSVGADSPASSETGSDSAGQSGVATSQP